MLTRRTFVAATLIAPVAAHARDAAIKLRDLYKKDGSFSDLAESLKGERITVEGFMAPPLKAESRFFVLTKRPLATCPFCETAAEWPDTILAVYTKRIIDTVPFNVGIEARGVLELGEFRDGDTGFLSMVRLVDATYG